MKKILTLITICFLSFTAALASEKGKSINSLKAQVHLVGGSYVLVPTAYCGYNFSPIGLPAEYQIEGLTVTLDGISYQDRKGNADLEIHKVGVDKDVMDQLALRNIAYIIKSTSEQVLNY